MPVSQSIREQLLSSFRTELSEHVQAVRLSISIDNMKSIHFLGDKQ